jgi:hypothetical protein
MPGKECSPVGWWLEAARLAVDCLRWPLGLSWLLCHCPLHWRKLALSHCPTSRVQPALQQLHCDWTLRWSPRLP